MCTRPASAWERSKCSRFSSAADWGREQQQHARLADELDQRVRPTAGYFVDFQIERCQRDPAPRRFAEFVARRIAELPDPQELELCPAPGPDDIPSAVYEHDGCLISIRFIPMRGDAAARTDPDACASSAWAR